MIIGKHNTTYAAILDKWIAAHRLKIMESTAYNYDKIIPRVKDALGDKPIRAITPQMIYDYMHSLRGIAQTTVRNYGKVIKGSFKYGLQHGYIYYNPCDDVAFPKRIRTEITAFSIAEIGLLLATHAPDWVIDGIVIAYRTGMRPGEIYALKWSDINLADGHISVQRSISHASSKVKTTKTPTGVRRIDIDGHLVDYLCGMLARKPMSEYVFPSGAQGNHPYRVPWNLAAVLRGMCTQAGIAPRNFYSLRHTHATLLLEAGVHPKIVQERMGHKDIRMTLSVYSHITPTIQYDAVKAMDTIALPNLY